jgi:ligand-binding sensor domain-containing protein/signal transduction histidine kinase
MLFKGFRAAGLLLLCCWGEGTAFSLDTLKALTQYTRAAWTQEDGLPQDAISAVVQTNDGYLWVGTDEGLARFDGYEFTVFNRNNSQLASNSILALAAGKDGSLWIGTGSGLTHYSNKEFHNYAIPEEPDLSPNTDLFVDHTGTLWVVTGTSLSRFDGRSLKVFASAQDFPFRINTVCEDSNHVLWVAGYGGAAEWTGRKFVTVIDASVVRGNLITKVVADSQGNVWMGGSLGLVERTAEGQIRKFDVKDGLPDTYVRTLMVGSDGSLWAGTNSGLARGMNGRFTALADSANRELMRCLYQDREGDLWVGSNSGLSRFRDDLFTVYGKSEGFPGDDPNTAFQDRSGRMWVGFHNSGLLLLSPEGSHVYTAHDVLPHNEIFSIREARDGTLLMGTRGGLVQVHGTNFETYRATDELGQGQVFDALEDNKGRVWLAMASGLGEIEAGKMRVVIRSTGPLDTFVSLLSEPNGTLWAGTYGLGLWRIRGADRRHLTMIDGLSSNHIRNLYQDPEGTIWIPTFDGGLNMMRKGGLTHFTTKDGLLSDNISNVIDDQQSLWLSTTRGICRVPKQQLKDFADHKIQALVPTNYGVEDGLRSAQCAPGYPVARGGTRTSDGQLWFPTGRGMAVLDTKMNPRRELPPIVHLVEVSVEGKPIDLEKNPQLPPGSERIQFRYTATHLSAPSRVEYYHKLEGLDKDWVFAGHQRQINYNSLPRGRYRFLVRAELPGGTASEKAYEFEKLPAFYETVWFHSLLAVALIACAWGVYFIRVRQLRYRFNLVLQERGRLAREIHDTLAQGFIGISSQLEAVAAEVQEGSRARRYLDTARRMARHSITEARRSIYDLRASMLEGRNLAAALSAGAQIWTAGSGVDVQVDVSDVERGLSNEYEQHLLRIAQEAVVNAVKHAGASAISVNLRVEAGKILMRISDNGRGFGPEQIFSTADGHFGLIGMRERAERLGGELSLASGPGKGTSIEVTVPLP